MASQLITNYSSLQATVADWLNRTDLTEAIKVFISSAEDKFRRDSRLVTLKRTSLTVDAELESLPSDFKRLDSLYHDGATHYGPVEIVPGDALGQVKGNLGDSSVPRYAAIVPPTIVFAPEPNGSYSLVMHYWATVTKLSATTTTNWLLLESPDIYLYGALVESAPYTKDDERLSIWKMELEERIRQFHVYRQNQHYGGSLVRKPRRRAIG